MGKQKQQMKSASPADQARQAGKAGADRMNQAGKESRKGQSGNNQHAQAPAGSKPQDWKNIPGNQS